MAKVAGAFAEFPGMDAIGEFQRKIDKLYNPSWLRQLDQIERIQKQLSASIDAYETIQPAVLSSASAVAQAWPTALPDILSDVLHHPVSVEVAFVPTPAFPSYYEELQSSLSTHLLGWSAVNTAVERERAIAQACTLVGHLTDVVDADEADRIDLPSELSAEDEQLLADEVSLVSVSEKNWEQRLMERMAQLKETHPVIAWVLYHVFVSILFGIIASLAATAIWQATTSAKVYEKPNTESPIIYRLEPLQQVKVIGEQPYYFQIELTDNSTQETMVGFVSKRSLKEVEVQNETPSCD